MVHAVATFAAGVVLFAVPNAIGGAVGIVLPREHFFVLYLLAASEFAVATLCFLARRVTDVAALRAVVATLIVFHVVSGLGGAYAATQGVSPAVWFNVALRVVMVGLLVRFRPPGSAPS